MQSLLTPPSVPSPRSSTRFVILRAKQLGMCFGVRDAIELARTEAARAPLTILGELVHNESVLADLRDRGIKIARGSDAIGTARVMVTAHGTSDRSRKSLEDRGLQVVEATCPLVHHAHESLRRLVAEGCHPVVIGIRDHVEVRGLTGDYDNADVILEPEDVLGLAERPRYGVVAQTTQPLARVRELVECLRLRFPNSEVRWADTVCQPTKLRQQAAEDLSRRADVIVVIGGRNSNNTAELAKTCAKDGARVHRVSGPEDLDPAWFEQARVVGLTAGTSTPDVVIDAVESRLEALGGVARFTREPGPRAS